MKLQELMSYTRKAIDEYNMIDDGDYVAIGISGGKDSIAMLYALSGLRRFYPKHFEIIGISADLGWDNVDYSEIIKIAQDLEVEYKIIRTDIAKIVFEDRKEKNPCALCAKMRKGAINQTIKELGCNKIAYGHHKDDIIETLFMSLLFEGRIHTFSPVTYLDRTNITAIRPLMYMKESDVINFIRSNNIPIVKSPCPVDGHTMREYAKQLVNSLESDHIGIKARIYTAITNSNIKGWE